MQKGEELFKRKDINQLCLVIHLKGGNNPEGSTAFNIFILYYIAYYINLWLREVWHILKNNYENILCATYHVIHHITYLCDFTK